MKKIWYTIQDGQFSCELNVRQFENIALQQQMEAMMGGHGIVRSLHENLRLYIGPENQLEYFCGIFRMNGYEINAIQK